MSSWGPATPGSSKPLQVGAIPVFSYPWKPLELTQLTMVPGGQPQPCSWCLGGWQPPCSLPSGLHCVPGWDSNFQLSVSLLSSPHGSILCSCKTRQHSNCTVLPFYLVGARTQEILVKSQPAPRIRTPYLQSGSLHSYLHTVWHRHKTFWNT